MREMGDNSFETLLEEQKNAHFTSKKDEKITRLFDLGRGKRANLANVNPQERECWSCLRHYTCKCPPTEEEERLVSQWRVMRRSE